MNQKGFAISGMVYGILIVFLILVFSLLGILVGRKANLDKIRNNAFNTIYGKESINDLNIRSNIKANWKKMYVNNEISSLISNYATLDVTSSYGYRIESETDFTFGNIGNNYDINYKAYDSNNNLVDVITRKITESTDTGTIYNYTGNKEEVTLAPGIYKLEVWGAQGGSGSLGIGGKGGYAKGYLTLTEDTKLYIYVGGAGSLGSSVTRGGFNGGGSSISGPTGGGASDIRIGTDSEYARVIVAGGGGGASSSTIYTVNGGAGGGPYGENGGVADISVNATSATAGLGASVREGGATFNPSYGSKGFFNLGGSFIIDTNSGSGGGGFFGGGVGDKENAGGGGGSGFTYEESTANDVTTDKLGGTWLLGSKYYLIGTTKISGSNTMPNASNGTQIGQSGNGNVKITPMLTYEY